MNYPFANAVTDYVKGGSAEKLLNTVLNILENYPPQAVKLLMNHIGTHDTARAITVLGAHDGYVGDRKWQSERVLSAEEYNRGVGLLKLAAVLQFTLPGVPSIYYGDEAGLTGYGDPFCRAAYPWGRENTELLSFYRALGALRRSSPAFASGEFVPIRAESGVFAFLRKRGGSTAFIAVNSGDGTAVTDLPPELKDIKTAFGEKPQGGKLTLSPKTYAVFTGES